MPLCVHTQITDCYTHINEWASDFIIKVKAACAWRKEDISSSFSGVNADIYYFCMRKN